MTRRGFNLPVAAEQAGYGFIYVALFSNDVIKCGSTTQPRQRLRDHAGNAAGFGLDLFDYWISHEHRNFIESESRLLVQVSVMGGRRNRREYFQGVNFVQVVNAAEAALEAAERAATDPVYGPGGERVFTLDQVAAAHGFTVPHLRTGIKNGWFAASLVDGRHGFTGQQVRDLLDAHVCGGEGQTAELPWNSKRERSAA